MDRTHPAAHAVARHPLAAIAAARCSGRCSRDRPRLPARQRATGACSPAWSYQTSSACGHETLATSEQPNGANPRRGQVRRYAAIGQVMIAKIRLHALRHMTQRRLLSEIGAKLGSLLLKFGQLGPQAPHLVVDGRTCPPGMLLSY